MILNEHIQTIFPVAAGGGGEGGHAPLAELSSGQHFKENKKLSYCWETVRRESIPRIAEMGVEMTT